jgi:putative inorganic carbon (HCO3(-)) transporter
MATSYSTGADHGGARTSPPQPARGPHRLALATQLLLAVVALVVAVPLSVLVLERGLDALLVLGGAVGGLLLAALAYARFEWFLLVALVIRAGLDAFKAGSGTLQPQPGSSGVAAGALGLLFIGAAAVWLVTQRRSGRPVGESALSKAIFVLILACLLSVATSPDRFASLSEAARIVATVLMFVVLESLLVDHHQVRRVVVACFASAVLPLVAAGYQIATGQGVVQPDGLSRLRGTFLHPNSFALYLALLLLVSLGLYRHVGRRQRLALLAFAAVAAPALVLTYSRGVWVATAVGVLTIGLLQSRRALLTVGVAVVMLAVAIPSLLGRLTDLEESRSVAGTPGNSLVWRMEYWRTTLELAKANPVTGIGLNMTERSTREAKITHNEYLRAQVEMGLVGLLAYLGFVVALVATSRRALAAKVTGAPRGLAVGFAGCVAAFVVVGLGANLVSQLAVLWYFFAIAAAAVAVTRQLPKHPVDAC